MNAFLRPVLRRRQVLATALLGLLGVPCAVRAADRPLPAAESLAQELQQALSRGEPLVVMVSLHGCPFCKVVRESYLWPLRDTGLPVVQLDMRDRRTVLDFDGRSLTQDEWVRQHGVRIAPTVLFFGASAKEVAPRLNGAYLPDFYNAYLEEHLATARRAVQSKPSSRAGQS